MAVSIYTASLWSTKRYHSKILSAIVTLTFLPENYMMSVARQLMQREILPPNLKFFVTFLLDLRA